MYRHRSWLNDVMFKAAMPMPAVASLPQNLRSASVGIWGNSSVVIRKSRDRWYHYSRRWWTTRVLVPKQSNQKFGSPRAWNYADHGVQEGMKRWCLQTLNCRPPDQNSELQNWSRGYNIESSWDCKLRSEVNWSWSRKPQRKDADFSPTKACNDALLVKI